MGWKIEVLTNESNYSYCVEELNNEAQNQLLSQSAILWLHKNQQVSYVKFDTAGFQSGNVQKMAIDVVVIDENESNVVRKWLYKPFVPSVVLVNLLQDKIVINGENNTCILPHPKPINIFKFFTDLSIKDKEVTELKQKVESFEKFFYDTSLKDSSDLTISNELDNPTVFDICTYKSGEFEEDSIVSSNLLTSNNSSGNIVIIESNPSGENENNNNNNKNSNHSDCNSNKNNNNNNSNLPKKKLSVEECLQSVFQKGTTHYLNTSLIVQSFIMKDEKNIENIRKTIMSSIYESLAVSKPIELRQFGIRCLRSILRKEGGCPEICALWKEAKRSFTIQPYFLIEITSITLGKELGGGAFGIVQQGVWEREVGNFVDVAVKFISDNNALFDLDDFRSELVAMSLLDHPNIIQMYGCGSFKSKSGVVGMADTTTWFIVMELMDRNLEKVIHSNEEMSVSFIVRVLKEISIALLFMHTSALLHRDIKPANILNLVKLLTKNEQLDASRKSKLGDLGIARDNSGTMKTAIGTLEYTAPELHFFGGKVDYGPEIDVYSLGVVIWECFAREKPRSDPKILNKKPKYLFTPPSSCPTDIGKLIKKCTAFNPNHRPSVQSIIDSLEAFEKSLLKSRPAKKKSSKN